MIEMNANNRSAGDKIAFFHLFLRRTRAKKQVPQRTFLHTSEENVLPNAEHGKISRVCRRSGVFRLPRRGTECLSVNTSTRLWRCLCAHVQAQRESGKSYDECRCRACLTYTKQSLDSGKRTEQDDSMSRRNGKQKSFFWYLCVYRKRRMSILFLAQSKSATEQAFEENVQRRICFP